MSPIELRYPLTAESGGLALTKYPNSEKVLSVLATRKGERVLRPDYGSLVTVFSATTGELPADLENLPALVSVLYDRLEVSVLEE